MPRKKIKTSRIAKAKKIKFKSNLLKKVNKKNAPQKKVLKKKKVALIKKAKTKKVVKIVLAPIKGQKIEVKLIKEQPVIPILVTSSPVSLVDKLTDLIKNNNYSADGFKDFDFNDQMDFIPPAEVDQPEETPVEAVLEEVEALEDLATEEVYLRTRWVDKLSPGMKKFVLYSSLVSIMVVLVAFSFITIKNSLGQTFSQLQDDLQGSEIYQSELKQSIDSLTQGMQNVGSAIENNASQQINMIEQLRAKAIEQKIKQEALDQVKEQLLEPVTQQNFNTNINQ